MEQLIILLVGMIILLMVALVTTRSAILSPQVGFIACFIPGIIYAFNYIEKWDLHMSGMTYGSILFGALTFLVISLLSGWLIRKSKRRSRRIRTLQFHNSIYAVKKSRLIIIIFVQLTSLALTVLFLIRNYGTNLSVAIGTFRRASVSNVEDFINLPGYIRFVRRLCMGSGYAAEYILLSKIIAKKNNNNLLICIWIALSVINGLMLGGRGDALQMLAAGIMQYFLISHKVTKEKLKFKTVLRTLLIVIAVIAVFSQVGELLGRNMSFLKFNDYIAVYLSAELKNLDLFIKRGNFGAPFSKSFTLAIPISIIARAFGISIGADQKMAFNYINGYALGNVYTTYYFFLHDGGLIGVFCYTGLMAFLAQLSFQHTLKENQPDCYSIRTILYSFIWSTIIYSFFSSKFYELVFNTTFLWTFLSWIIIKWLFKLKTPRSYRKIANIDINREKISGTE